MVWQLFATTRNTNFNFLSPLAGATRGRWSAASRRWLASVEISYAEYRNGNERSNAPRLIPTSHRHDDLVLRRGVVGTTDLFDWLKQARDGDPAPREITITLLDEGREPVVPWRLRRAQPKKWTGPTLSGVGTQVAIEELVLVYEGLDIE